MTAHTVYKCIWYWLKCKNWKKLSVQHWSF